MSKKAKQQIISEIKEQFAILEGEHFYMLDTECKIQKGELHIMPLDENDLKYSINELDEVGLALLYQYLLEIAIEKGVY